MRINNNLMAMNTHRQLGINANNGAKSIEKLSSGYRINRAGDDAAGLAISEKMRAQIRGLNQASRNSQDAISMIQTAEGALNETQAILQRMRELAVQSANDTNVNADRTSIQDEIDQLSTEITRISDTTEFNTQKLLDGTLSSVKFQIGANEDQDIDLSIGNMSAAALDVTAETVNMSNQGDAIEDVVVSDNFDIEGASLTASLGGAVNAEIDALAAGIDENGFADAITVNFSVGVTNSGNLDLNGSGKIQFASGTATSYLSGEISWDRIATSGDNGDIQIRKSGDYVVVKMSGIIDDSGQSFDFEDAILADASGDYVYDAHGMSFTIDSSEVADLSGASSGIKINLATANSGSGANFAASGIGVQNDFVDQTLDASGTNYASFSGQITFDPSSTEWISGIDNISVSGIDLSGSGGSITVTVSGGTETLINETITFSGAVSGDTFVFDDFGIYFAININEATDFTISKEITTHDNAVETNSGDLKLTITDDSGNNVNLTVNGFNSGTYSLDQIASGINAAAAASSGTFAGNIAVVSGDSLRLESAFEGEDSIVSITQDGFASPIFTSGDVDSGADSSVNLTLTDSTGSTIDSGVVQASDTSVTFTDSNGETATFELEGYSTLTGVNVSSAFAADGFERATAGIDVSSQSNAAEAITLINDAIESVSTERSKLGAVQNRLEHTIKNLDTSAENLQASESRIRDVDMAKEMMEFTKNNILQQAAQSMLAQANQAPQGVLQLLR